MAGDKETKEVIVATIALIKVLYGAFKDGAQLEDFVTFYDKLINDAVFKEKLLAAYDNYKAVPAEVVDLDFFEDLDLVKAAIEEAKS